MNTFAIVHVARTKEFHEYPVNYKIQW